MSDSFDSGSLRLARDLKDNDSAWLIACTQNPLWVSTEEVKAEWFPYPEDKYSCSIAISLVTCGQDGGDTSYQFFHQEHGNSELLCINIPSI